MKVNGQWVPCMCNSSYSFIPILLKLYRCLDDASKIACALDIISNEFNRGQHVQEAHL